MDPNCAYSVVSGAPIQPGGVGLVSLVHCTRRSVKTTGPSSGSKLSQSVGVGTRPPPIRINSPNRALVAVLVIVVPNQKLLGMLPTRSKNSRILRGHLVRNSQMCFLLISSRCGNNQVSGAGALGEKVSPKLFRNTMRGYPLNHGLSGRERPARSGQAIARSKRPAKNSGRVKRDGQPLMPA